MHFTPTTLKSLCSKYGLTPSKHYGQHFLISDWPIEKMIEAAKLAKSDTVIEIGPGFGALTFALAERAKKVVAFEIEKKLQPYWEKQKETGKLGNLEIVWGNALKKISNFKFQISNYKVVANLPYQITSNILRLFLEAENKPESMVLMVQKEVAERICAKPPKMSLLSVSVQYYGQPEIVAIVPKSNFWPEPAVDSAILVISKISRVSKLSSEKFFKVVKAGFANKRKQLWRNLSQSLKLESYKACPEPGRRVKSVLLEVAGNEKVRAEELGINDWNRIIDLLF